MSGTSGFSYTGCLFLLLLFIPNLIWTTHKPEGYSAAGENRILAAFEKAGQVLTTCTALCFSDYDPRGLSLWSGWLIAAAFCMLLYECWWIRYFCGGRTLQDFYSGLCGIPVAGAALPVMAFFLLGVYGKVIWLMSSALLLGIGHIGIHLQHRRQLRG